MKIKRINEDFTICKVLDYSQVNYNSEYYFISKTDQENSLVCLTKDTPANTIEREDGWRAFCIEGILDFSLIGILSKISTILANASIGIFAISTYDTDYILVKANDETRAYSVLIKEGYTII